MKKCDNSRICHAVPGDCISFRCEEETVIIFLPVKDFFPQYEELKRVFMSAVNPSNND